MSSRTYHDPLHRGINLDSQKPAEAMVMALIDTQPFQRLRRVKQLGPASLTFHGAESSRFTHSLGVFHLARWALKRLQEFDSSLKEYEGLLYASALLHDIGHAPLSHTGEEIFGVNHEVWSAKIVKEHHEIKSILEEYYPGTSDSVSSLLGKGDSPRNAIKSLVSSQLDCDRLDYLMRDSYSTGARYGHLDLDRIIKALTIAPDGDLAVHPKGLMSIEHYLVVRNLMYRSVYNHRLNEVCNWILEKLIRTARDIGPGKVWADSIMAKWLWQTEEINLKTFLENDDITTTYHISYWSKNAPAELSELCRRFIHRDLFKAISIGNLTRSQQLESLAIARKEAEGTGHNPDLCCGLRYKSWHGYHPYKGGLRLWDGKNLTALEKVSPLIETLTKPATSAWLIHPREISKQLHTKIKTVSK